MLGWGGRGGKGGDVGKEVEERGEGERQGIKGGGRKRMERER